MYPKRLLSKLLLGVLCSPLFVAAQTFTSVDINPGSGDALPGGFTTVGNNVFFTAENTANGNELWMTNGTSAGTMLSDDITAGAAGSFPDNLYSYNGKLYFKAAQHLYISNGTMGGAQVVSNVVFPSWITGFGTKVLMNAHASGGSDFEPYISDGTPGGTTLLKNINPGSFSNPSAFAAISSTVAVFAADDGTHGTELWVTDGTQGGTTLVKDINASGTTGSNPQNMTVFNGYAYFSADDGTTGDELWRTDGTLAGTTLVKDIASGSAGSSPQNFCVYNGKLYFQAGDGTHGTELWVTDGTGANTTMVKDVFPGGAGSNVANLTVYNNKLYFAADDGTNGTELWSTDGTLANTSMVKDLNASGPSVPTALTVCNGRLYFVANAAFSDLELATSDGTAAGTYFIKPAGVSLTDCLGSTQTLGVAGNTLVFNAKYSDATGNELWFLTGSPTAATNLSSDQPLKVYPNPFTNGFAITGLEKGITYTVRLFDITGRMVDSQQVTGSGNVETYNTSNLAKGMYHLIIESADNKQTVIKLVKQ